MTELQRYEVPFPGVDHAFFNDTDGRYDRAAATPPTGASSPGSGATLAER